LLGKKSAVVGTTRGRLYKINTQSNEVAPITDLFVSTHNDISVNVGQICCLAFNPSNSEVVVGEGLPSIMLTSVATKRFGAFMRVMPKNRSQTLAILSPISGAIRAEFGEQLRPPIQSVAWDPQNRYILVTDSTRQIFASTPAEPQLLEVVNEASVERPTLAVSPDGNRLAVASTQGLDIFGVSLENSGASDRSQP
jgi:DNA-binding beta-propeller fold protein YncE